MIIYVVLQHAFGLTSSGNFFRIKISLCTTMPLFVLLRTSITIDRLFIFSLSVFFLAAYRNWWIATRRGGRDGWYREFRWVNKSNFSEHFPRYCTIKYAMRETKRLYTASENQVDKFQSMKIQAAYDRLISSGYWGCVGSSCFFQAIRSIIL